MRFVVLIEYTDMAARNGALERHRAYLSEGRARGVVVESGPFVDGKGGMYILNVADEEKARKFVAADPYSQAKLKLTVRAWQSSRDGRDGL